MLFTLFILFAMSSATPQVQLGNTTVIGSAMPGYPLEFFGGIPFAEPPVRSLRLSATAVKTVLPLDTFNATNFGKSCLQPGISPELSSEDCLTVNIIRPVGLLSNASLPVMFWTYGGGFSGGSSSQYNPSAIVTQSVHRGTPIIYVSFNYRLGPLGFPQGSEAFQRGSLNLGLRDQVACLEWVQLFIGAFGGDPSKVTLFGQSAGAIMTAILFLNDISHLARAAIFESGQAATSALFTADRGEGDWQNFVGGVSSCNTQNMSNTFDCLQSVNSTEILSGWAAAAARTQVLFPWTPTLDGPDGLIPALPSVMLANGNFSPLPFIAGTNMDEGTIFTPNSTFSSESIHELIIANFTPPVDSVSHSDLENVAQTIVHIYPNDPVFGSPFCTGNETFGLQPGFKRAAAIEGDISFQSQRRLWAQIGATLGANVFAYLFTQPQTQTPPSLGVYHGSEVRFVYGGVGPDTSSDWHLSRAMIDYWISFATSLDPNDGLGVSRPLWTSYNSENSTVMQLNGDNITMIPDDYRKEQIQYIGDISEILHH